MKIIILLALLLVGCARQHVPTTVPNTTNYCAKGETTNCRPWTASEIAGPAGRGHSNQPEEPK